MIANDSTIYAKANTILRALYGAHLFYFSSEDFLSILNFDAKQTARFMRLLDRNASLTFELSQYQNMGIETITRADANYPKTLKKKLSNSCPPIFYFAGDLTLLERPTIGYVGSRNIGPEDLDFTIRTVRKTVSLGYGVVSGGAKGIDTIAGTEALLNDGYSVEYLSDSLLKKLKKSDAKDIPCAIGNQDDNHFACIIQGGAVK